MIRSLAFTLLLQVPEFAALDIGDASRIVTDAVERVQMDQTINPARTIDDSIAGYVRDVTASGTTEPGVWTRYLAALKAGDERRAGADTTLHQFRLTGKTIDTLLDCLRVAAEVRVDEEAEWAARLLCEGAGREVPYWAR